MPPKLDMLVRYKPSPDAMESRLGDETVILHLGNGTYFGLDAVGTVVWDVLRADQGASPMDVCKQVRKQFLDAPQTVDMDITAFLTQLAEHDLIKQV